LEDNKKIIDQVKATLQKMKEKEIEKGEYMEGPDFDNQEDPEKAYNDAMENNLSNEDTNSNSGAEAKNNETSSPSKKGKEKSLINQAGFSTLYKTPTKD
jgi:hypothetical protein